MLRYLLTAILLVVAGGLVPLKGAAQSLEMQASTGGPAGNGPSVANQVVTLRYNSDNPSGNTFAARTPAATVTYSLSDQQFTGYTPAQGFPAGTGGNGVMFAGNGVSYTINVASLPLYLSLSDVGTPASTLFTSSGNSAAGTGINPSVNGGITLFMSTRAFLLRPAGTRPATNQRVRMADLTLTFSEPVDNPIVHLTGVGGWSGDSSSNLMGITAGFDLTTPGLSLTRLSGNPALSVSGLSINNNATTPMLSCTPADEAACGSVRINGTGISSVTLRMFLRGDGTKSVWGNTNHHHGNTFLLGVSLDPVADLSITKTDGVTNYVAGQTLTYTIVASNQGPDTAINARFTDPAVSGLTVTGVTCGSTTGGATCPTAGNTTVALMQGTGGIVIPSLPNGGGVTFTVTGTVSASALSVTNTASIAGPANNAIRDPDPSNNSATDTNTRSTLLTLIKTVTNDHGGTQLPSAWTLTATGPTTITGATGTAAVTNANVTPGTYALTESATPTGYVASTYSCVKNSAAAVLGNSITLAAGDTATCTINNNDTNTTDLKIEKTAAPNPVLSGERVQLTLAVSNLGVAAAHGAVVRDPAVTGLDCTAASLPAVSCSATGGATCPGSLTASGLQAGAAIPTFPNGGVVTIGVACNVTATGVP